MKITAVIVDDEPLAQSYLESSLQAHCPQIEVVGIADNVHAAIALILEQQPEVAFLDIQMPGGSGFGILEAIPARMMPHFVFVTAYDQYAIRAIRAGALDYLLKPIEQKELQAVCDRISAKRSTRANPEAQRESLEQSISLSHQTGFALVRLKEIVHLEADNNYTHVHLADQRRQTSTQTLGNYEKTLPSAWFFRIHRSHLVNLYHLRSYNSREGGCVELSNGVILPVARQRIPDLMHHVSQLGMENGAGK